MRNITETLLDAAAGRHTTCGRCPWAATCSFTSRMFEPGYCLHEYKLVHAFVARRLRESPPTGADDYARLADQVDRYAEFLATERPFDPQSMSNPVPAGAGVPFPPLMEQRSLASFA